MQTELIETFSVLSIFVLLPQEKLQDLPQVSVMIATNGLFLLSLHTFLTKCPFYIRQRNPRKSPGRQKKSQKETWQLPILTYRLWSYPTCLALVDFSMAVCNSWAFSHNHLPFPPLLAGRELAWPSGQHTPTTSLPVAVLWFLWDSLVLLLNIEPKGSKTKKEPQRHPVLGTARWASRFLATSLSAIQPQLQQNADKWTL